MPTKKWRNFPLPKRRLAPLLHTYSKEFRRVREQVTHPLILRALGEVREHRETLHLRRDRAARVTNQRQRLNAAYWADWRPRSSPWRRHEGGAIPGPKWLGGRP